MEDYILSDIPISEEKDDKFQRYQFSKHIAESIINRNSNNNIVIGIYGAWGEGKTSVLNFIEKELANNDKIITIKFNPWRYNDEITTLKQFFQVLATVLKANLKTKKEEVGKFLQKYGKLLSIEIPYIGNFGDKIEKTGDLIAEVDIDTMKKRIDDILVENGKKVVIFIDDLDRLEKNEIYAVFRLVKLTGDFTNTTYVLSFDENIVSAAIGERFGAGDQEAGFNFLEKIIQIPLKIPLAQKGALMKYCFDLVDRSIKESGIILSNLDYENFINKFISYFLIRLNTPRLAVRYANSLSFSLPLLKGEVNYVDLLLIEAIKVFFPEHYMLIRNQPFYYTGTYKYSNSNKLDKIKIEEFKDIFENNCKNYIPEEKRKVKEILSKLFPNLGYVWDPNWNIDPVIEKLKYNEKRISSPHYFNRYFSYTVIEGDISDVAFDELIEFIMDGDYLDKIDKTTAFLKLTSPENFILKIRNRESSFDNKSAIQIVKIFSQLGDYFPIRPDNIFPYSTSHLQAALFITQLVHYQIEPSQKKDIMIWLIINSKPLLFAYKIFDCWNNEIDEINRHIVNELNTYTINEENKHLFTGELLKRAMNEAGDKPIWIDFKEVSCFLLMRWGPYLNTKEIDDYLKKQLNKNSKEVINLLKMFTPIFTDFSYPSSYNDDLEKVKYDWLKNMVDINFIYEKVCENVDKSLISIQKYESIQPHQTDENLLKQFLYWYNIDKTEKKV